MAGARGGETALNRGRGADVSAKAFVGVDLGTSGCRAVAIDAGGAEVARAALPLPPPAHPFPGGSEQSPECWWTAVAGVLKEIGAILASAAYVVDAIAVDGTSSTLLLADSDGRPRSPALMYDDSRSRSALPLIARHADPDSAVHSAYSSLAKAVHLKETLRPSAGDQLLHQSDWVMGRLRGRFGVSDENNCLKLGFDQGLRRWPRWIDRLGFDRALFPEVVPAGTVVGTLDPSLAGELGLPPGARVVAGTTDSTAAVLASGIAEAGEACTVLGSTLVLKCLSETPLFDARYGIYSHRVGDRWLVGGASNSGCAVLDTFFTVDEMVSLSSGIDPERSTGLQCYPLSRRGERFPISDPDLEPCLPPCADQPARFLQALMEGIARIERQGYALLARKGAPAVRSVTTLGGGARNPVWTRIRERVLGVPVSALPQREAAYGTALLARRGVKRGAADRRARQASEGMPPNDAR